MDDLYDPLGLNRVRPKWRIPFRLILSAALGIALLSPFLVLRFAGNSFEGEPQAVAEIVPRVPQTPQPTASLQNPPSAPSMARASFGTPRQAVVENVSDLEHRSGVKVVRLDGGTAPDAAIIEVPRALDVGLAPAPDPRLVEKSRYGLLPRIGTDGARPAEVYARPLITASAAKPDAPRIALVLGGLGLSRAATDAAIRLPGSVTLAFAPYGKNLQADVALARAQGHEVILQLPMEPIDYPETSPRPHMLLSTASSAENADNLHWLMSRFVGYPGVANFLGAKLTADSAAFSPILHEIAERGLFYLDDGSSAQSLSLTLAANFGLAATKADVVIDAMPAGGGAAFLKLEAIARDKGIAIGMASALPGVLEEIYRFAQTAQGRGLVLVPMSAAVGKSAPALVTRDP